MPCRVGQKMNTENSAPHNQDPEFKISLLHPKYLPTWLGMGLIYLAKFLPYKVLIFMGTILGQLLYLISPHRKQIAKDTDRDNFMDAQQSLDYGLIDVVLSDREEISK